MPHYSQVHERGVQVIVDKDGSAPEIKHKLDDLLPRVVLRGPIVIKSLRDYAIFGPIGSRNDFLTVTFAPGLWLTTGCFSGTIEEFEAELYKMSDPTPFVAGGGFAKSERERQEYEAVLACIRTLALTRIVPMPVAEGVETGQPSSIY